MFPPVKIWQLCVRTTTVRMQSRQFHSQSLLNGQSSIFAHELRKYSQNLTFTGRVPGNNWMLGLQRKWHSASEEFRKFSNWRRRKPRHVHSVQNVFACVSKHCSQYHVRIEKQSEVFCTVKTTCRRWGIVYRTSFRYADLSQGFGVAFSFFTVKRKGHIITYLLTSQARSVFILPKSRPDIFSIQTSPSINKKLISSDRLNKLRQA